MKTIEVKTNKNGIKYALVSIPGANDVTYAVYKLCENYAAHCKGGIAKTWRYVEKNMAFEDALTLFKRRSK